jgi:hypothetical protein
MFVSFALYFNQEKYDLAAFSAHFIPSANLMDFVGTQRSSVQASNQDNGSRLSAAGSSSADTCPHGSGSWLRAAPWLPCVPAAPALASWLGAAPGPPRAPVAPAPASRLGVAPGPPRVTWAPAPTFWLRAAPELSCVPRTISAGCKQLNKYSVMTRPS